MSEATDSELSGSQLSGSQLSGSELSGSELSGSELSGSELSDGPRPRKVLHVLNSAGGGAALSTIALMEQLRAHGIRSAAVCHNAGTPEERERLRDAVEGELTFTRLYWWNRKIRMADWKRPLAEAKQWLITLGTLRSTACVVRAARRYGADMIHTNTILTPEGGLAARRLGLPHVWHLRELVGPGNPFRLPREGLAFGSFMANYCDKLVANSDTSAAAVRSWLPAGLLDVVHNGIDLNRFQPRATAPPADRIVVGMVGNLTSRTKKHLLFIEAAAQVDRALPIEWRIYGHDPSEGGRKPGDEYLDQLHARIGLAGLSRQFHFPGFLSDPVEIMSQVDILVHPADNESFGRVVVEAMAAGLPAIGVRGGGVAEIIREGETGLLAEPDTPQSLAECIQRVARDPHWARQLGAAGRRRAETHYALTACTTNMLRVYSEALQNHRVAAKAS